MKTADSKHNYLIQLTDVLLGALSYHAAGDIPTATARHELFEYIVRAIEKAPTTQKNLDKVTIVNWAPPEHVPCLGHRD